MSRNSLQNYIDQVDAAHVQKLSIGQKVLEVGKFGCHTAIVVAINNPNRRNMCGFKHTIGVEIIGLPTDVKRPMYRLGQVLDNVPCSNWQPITD